MRLRMTPVAAAIAVALALPAGAQAKIVTKTFTSGNLNASLTNPGLYPFKKPIKVRGIVRDVNLSVRLSTGNANGALKHLMSLRAPNGAVVGLSGQMPSPGYGSGAGSCAGTPVTFDDEASEEIGAAPPGELSGSYTPNQPLSGKAGTGFVDGSQIKGSWDLVISTNWLGVPNYPTSTLHCWKLTIRYKPAPKKKAAKRKRAKRRAAGKPGKLRARH